MKCKLKNIAGNAKKLLIKNSSKIQLLLAAAVLLAISTKSAFADGSDVLLPLQDSVKAMFTGTVKILLYAAEGFVSAYRFIRTRNLLEIGGIVIISLGLNYILHMIGWA